MVEWNCGPITGFANCDSAPRAHERTPGLGGTLTCQMSLSALAWVCRQRMMRTGGNESWTGIEGRLGRAEVCCHVIVKRVEGGKWRVGGKLHCLGCEACSATRKFTMSTKVEIRSGSNCKCSQPIIQNESQVTDVLLR